MWWAPSVSQRSFANREAGELRETEEEMGCGSLRPQTSVKIWWLSVCLTEEG